MVPPPQRCPRHSSQPNIRAISPMASFSIRELARLLSSAWLLGLTHIASA